MAAQSKNRRRLTDLYEFYGTQDSSGSRLVGGPQGRKRGKNHSFSGVKEPDGTPGQLKFGKRRTPSLSRNYVGRAGFGGVGGVGKGGGAGGSGGDRAERTMRAFRGFSVPGFDGGGVGSVGSVAVSRVPGSRERSHGRRHGAGLGLGDEVYVNDVPLKVQ